MEIRRLFSAVYLFLGFVVSLGLGITFHFGGLAAVAGTCLVTIAIAYGVLKK